MVALEEPFVCPECGNTLVPPALEAMPGRGRRVALLAAAFALVAIAAGATVLARGGLFRQPAPTPAETPVIASFAPAILTGPMVSFVQDTLADILPATWDVEDATMPAHALHKMPAKTRAQHLAPGQALKDPVGGHHANVHMSVSVPLVAGGEPDYPEQYQDGRSGDVTVACALQPDGSPTQCRTTQQSGGRIFDVAVHSWLDLRDVRFAPPHLRHRPPIRTVTLRVQFIGDGPAPQ